MNIRVTSKPRKSRKNKRVPFKAGKGKAPAGYYWDNSKGHWKPKKLNNGKDTQKKTKI